MGLNEKQQNKYNTENKHVQLDSISTLNTDSNEVQMDSNEPNTTTTHELNSYPKK